MKTPLNLRDMKKDLTDLVNEWNEKYPKKGRKKKFDIKKVKVNRRCQKAGCDTKSDLARHHKGYESLFARLRPDLYARRYMDFRPRDLVDLCHYHHERLHRYYLGWIKNDVMEMVYDRLRRPKLIRVLLTKTQCEGWRRQMIEMTNSFVKDATK